MADDHGDSDEAGVLRPLQAAACTYRIALGPRAGQKVLTLQGAMPREPDFNQTLCADNQGSSLHAAARCAADDRQALEQLCRYITRPRSSAASGLTSAIHRSSCGPQPRAAGIGCARASQGPGPLDTPSRPQRHEKRV
jgi:hypothetical protein